MSVAANAEPMLGLLHGTIIALVRRAGPDLSARQMGVLLICYLDDIPQTVRGLAAALNVSKPAITRALDRLGEFDLTRRKADPADRRSVLLQRTMKGTALVRDIRAILVSAASGEVAQAVSVRRRAGKSAAA